jgi:hypothetical protein
MIKVTVIAWDGNILAADGRSTRGMDIVSDNVTKIHPVNHPKYGPMKAAFCGACLVVDPWIEHIEEHGFDEFEMPGEQGEFGATAVLVDDTGRAFELDTNGLWQRVTHPTAYGSGCDIGQHYLKKGAGSLEAVRQTIVSNNTCGGRILTWDYKTGKFHSYAK